MKYYEILGLNDKATNKDIKKAYIKLSIKNHPNKGVNSDKFKFITEAYEILSCPNKKKTYDNGFSDRLYINFTDPDIFFKHIIGKSDKKMYRKFEKGNILYDDWYIFDDINNSYVLNNDTNYFKSYYEKKYRLSDIKFL